MAKFSTFSLLESSNWSDYVLLDSGDRLKLERFGPYKFVRPEIQATWQRALPEKDWADVHAKFHPTREERGGYWQFKKKVAKKWKMTYGDLRFWAMTTQGRHLGVFPECAAHWDWIVDLVQKAARPIKVLNLFGYTGLATLAAAMAGAHVTHVDASKRAVTWARDNQALSKLTDRPVRWIVDDALKFVQREGRREKKYDGILFDPPKFGRGPKGEVWEVYKSLPDLIDACYQVLSNEPLFVIATVYAVKESSINIEQALQNMMSKHQGVVESGELVTREQSAGRLLSQALYARWSSG
jgi:23S rRNA (cytosine1962-C5)-methyltransferase